MSTSTTPDPGPTTSVETSVPVASAGRSRTPLLLAAGVALVGVVAAGGTALALRSDDGSTSTAQVRAGGAAGPAAEPVVAAPTAAVAGAGAGGLVPWSSPLSITAADGTLVSVSAIDPDGTPVAGSVSGSGWQSSGTLIPAATYTVTATVKDANGDTSTVPVTARTTPASKIVTAAISPGDGKVVGVGQAVAVRLDQPAISQQARAAVERRLKVRTTPSVEGAWHWMSNTEVHYRAADFWASGTKISVQSNFTHMTLGDGTWGSGIRSTTFTVGSALTSVVDVQKHTMTVSRDGKVLRVMPASMGKPGFATRNGTFVVLEKFKDKIMDSATVNLPAGTPAYRTAVKNAVRITNSGTFTHGAPWSVRSQGVRNVSHGCVNLSPANAAWYFDQAKKGDVVKVVGSTRNANSYDAGSRDWIMSFAEWKKGSALSA